MNAEQQRTYQPDKAVTSIAKRLDQKGQAEATNQPTEISTTSHAIRPGKACGKTGGQCSKDSLNTVAIGEQHKGLSGWHVTSRLNGNRHQPWLW